MNKSFGQFVPNASLSEIERNLVAAAWDASSRGWDHFPVGSAILAVNRQNESKIFLGCNVANQTFSAVLCAEHNAVTTAVQEEYTVFTHVAVVCRNQPGGFPCGICRQALKQYAAPDAVMLGVVDSESNVCRVAVRDLLPSPLGPKLAYLDLSSADQLIVDQAVASIANAYVPYSKLRRAAVAVASNPNDKQGRFVGVQIDNASYPVSVSAEIAAVACAISAGYNRVDKLAVAVGTGREEIVDCSIDGESLQFLREFGGVLAEILLIGVERSIVFTTVEALLPGSFGPESLGTISCADQK